MNEEAGPSENDSDHAQHHSEHPEKSASGKQSDGCDHQSYFKKDFRQVITIGSISLRSDFGLHLSCLILDSLLIVFVTCRLAGVFFAQFGQSDFWKKWIGLFWRSHEVVLRHIAIRVLFYGTLHDSLHRWL